MNLKTLRLLCVLSWAFLPRHAGAQCKDQLCQNLQSILSAAVTDFREFRTMKNAAPDASTRDVKVPCQMTSWANNVPMYICYAQVSSASAENWYLITLDTLRLLEPSWHFQIESPGADRYVEAGPPECEVPATQGPYLGLCPLHMQYAKQPDGSSKLYLWMSSLSSPYLIKRPPGPARKPTPVSTATNGCDELCQGLKKAFEARATFFEELHSRNASADDTNSVLKLAGAENCSVGPASKSHSNQAGIEYVCYWREVSAPAAETRFREFSARLQILAPSDWAAYQEDVQEELTGAKANAWLATSPDAKQEVALYISNQSVGLHIVVWK